MKSPLGPIEKRQFVAVFVCIMRAKGGNRRYRAGHIFSTSK